MNRRAFLTLTGIAGASFALGRGCASSEEALHLLPRITSSTRSSVSAQSLGKPPRK